MTQYTQDLSPGFFTRLKEMCGRLDINPEHLLAVMFCESELRASARNPAGSMGINQMMTYADLDTPLSVAGPGADWTKKQGFVLYDVGWRKTPREYLKLSAEAQLPFVERYFKTYAHFGLNTPARLYQCNYVPATLALGSSPNLPLAKKGTLNYDQNAGLDVTKDGVITPADLDLWIEKRTKDALRFQEALQRLRQAPDSSLPALTSDIHNVLNPDQFPVSPNKIGVGLVFAMLAGGSLAFWLTRKP
jgi:hypothetical protein